MVNRVYNFSAGPAMLPEEVLKEAASEMMDYRGCGMSVMEMSHRSQVSMTSSMRQSRTYGTCFRFRTTTRYYFFRAGHHSSLP